MSGNTENTTPWAAQPQPVLGLGDAIALIVGIVIGAGIFKTPALVAANAGGTWAMLAAWLLGGIVPLIGARSNYALGRDWPLLGFLGHWNTRTGSPTQALLLQGAVALALIACGAFMRQGFETMMDYTAPVFWLFFLLTGISLFVLRRRAND